MPQLPFDTNAVSVSCSVMARSDTRMSDAPTPQLAPVASGADARPSNTRVRSPGSRPIIVRPAVSNEHVATYGTPTRDGGVGRGPHLLGRRHRLDPRDVGPTGDERLDLLAERRRARRPR